MQISANLLLKEAHAARQNAYAPYSHFHVGAALLGENGKIYRGCNVENASYGAAVCAERVAVGVGIADGCRRFVALAIVGAPADQSALTPCLPCGICRQVLAEFCADEMPLYLQDGDAVRVVELGELLPEAFRLS